MYKRDYRDLIGGGLMVLLGAGVVIYGLMTMSMGTLQRMGPGFFPISVGVLLAIVGAGIFVPALLREGAIEEINWRPLIAVPAGLAIFALGFPFFGLVVAIFALVAVATFGQDRVHPVSIAATAAFLSLLCFAIFNVGLGQAIPMLRWPL
jgi:hypothetical protein